MIVHLCRNYFAVIHFFKTTPCGLSFFYYLCNDNARVRAMLDLKNVLICLITSIMVLLEKN